MVIRKAPVMHLHRPDKSSTGGVRGREHYLILTIRQYHATGQHFSSRKCQSHSRSFYTMGKPYRPQVAPALLTAGYAKGQRRSSLKFPKRRERSPVLTIH